MLRCAIYIRVSTEEQAMHGLSMDAQKADLTDYAKKHNYEIIDYYVDSGKTARKRLSKRKDLQRMIEDVKLNKIDIIIFTKLDRWFRNVRDYYKVQEVLEDHNVDWKTIFENYDTSTANGRLHINIMLSVAQDEADRTSERIKRVFESKLKNNEPTSGSLPIGYKIKEKSIIIDEEKAPLAKDVFDFYYYHQSQAKVFKEILNKYNLSLCEKTIRRMLENKLYIGIYREHENFCPPLIDKNKFDEVQLILKRRNIKYIPTKRIFLFTSLLICKECRHKMIGNAQIRNTKAGKIEYILYRCNQSYVRHTCSHRKVIYENKIETYLLNNIESELKKFIYDYELEDIPKVKNKVNKTNIKRKLEKLKELYINDLIDIDMYKEDYERYTEILNTKEEKIEQRNLQPLKDFLNSDFKSLYSSISREEKRLLWRGIISEIQIDCNNDITIIPHP
ncbi:site-specific recombinase [Clostridium botulinum]|uniref:recombinase family protein n=1 Tax=unclassified Clostridium TaxID=2614128 RepID=UPI0013C598AA|nr:MULTISPECIES: recombinase family protein [unclassified Clostridium]MBY7008958.1 recombinase family protein [Clostridium botulinum]NFH73842.1 site-specific recombinase [Clostridium botulinum]NFJ73914.1 site-specific recombinase [Clostridium botulinum]NFN64064.1 site-specific recombinase [Clostridium botulinum]NFN78561.1 site-specific recombinase [Clostridium botulinum]